MDEAVTALRTDADKSIVDESSACHLGTHVFVYLDESGDAGFKFRQGSSRYFIITLLLVTDPLPFHEAVDQLRISLGFAPGNELKWVNSSADVRWAFLRMLRRQDFTARVLVIDKELMTAPHMRKRETFYNFLVQLVLRHDNGTIHEATLILDESVESKKSKQHLATYLRKQLNTHPELRKIRDVRYHTSHADNLIQATDMLTGAIGTRYRRGNAAYLDYIRVKISDLWEWYPKTQ